MAIRGDDAVASGTTTPRHALVFDLALVIGGVVLAFALAGPLPAWASIPVAAVIVANSIVCGTLISGWVRTIAEDRRAANADVPQSSGRLAGARTR